MRPARCSSSNWMRHPPPAGTGVGPRRPTPTPSPPRSRSAASPSSAPSRSAGRRRRPRGRGREAALQLRVGLEALLAELRDAMADPGHLEDLAVLEERRGEAGEAANAALRGDLPEADARNVRELLELSERVLRRRRLLRG